jgi:hypothetical protein
MKESTILSQIQFLLLVKLRNREMGRLRNNNIPPVALPTLPRAMWGSLALPHHLRVDAEEWKRHGCQGHDCAARTRREVFHYLEKELF